uniref:Death domain-containing protein n=1 Tax=Amphimedon queenslandica TaxID=400682 RepID=A0A1X7UWC6_AMPQE
MAEGFTLMRQKSVRDSKDSKKLQELQKDSTKAPKGSIQDSKFVLELVSDPSSITDTTILLNIEHLDRVLSELEHFADAEWEHFGLKCGLHYNTLKRIESDTGSTKKRFRECVACWLRREDDVDKKGKPTLQRLADIVEVTGDKAAAEKIRIKFREAIQIFNTHHPLLSQSLSDPVSVAIMLQREGVITGQVLDSVESASPSVPNQREILLAAIRKAIQSNYSSLQTFASVLCKSNGNVELGTFIQRDYNKHISSNEVVNITIEEEVEIPVLKSKSREFSSIRASLGRMLYKVDKAILKKSPSIDDIKLLIKSYNLDLKPKLENCLDLSDVLDVVKGECSLTDISLLEAIVEKFEVTEAERYIEQYKTTLEEFCHSMSVELCLKEKFDAVNTSPSLKCESATYVFDWRPDEKKLKDITDILSKTSGKFVKIKYIDTGYSIVVTCSFFRSVMKRLIIKLSENLALLKESGLMKLTVGYRTIWIKDEIQEIKEPLETKTKSELPQATKVASVGEKIELKVLFIGDLGVGKTSIVQLLKNKKVIWFPQTTIALDIVSIDAETPDTIVELHLYDTAGLERHRALTRQFYRNADIAIFVFSIDDGDSFRHIEQVWRQEVLNHNEKDNVKMILIGNKDDCNEERVNPKSTNMIIKR